MTHWANDAIFYHIYPLGHCGAPTRNDFRSEVVPRLECLHAWIPHLQSLGVNALYLGPVFESTAHGYDTRDLMQVDCRLGTNETLKRLAERLQAHGIRLVLDAVFHHVGRDFWAFQDVLAHGQHSRYCTWFHLSFTGTSPYGDPFVYEGWHGHYDLVKLNLANPEVRAHLFAAVSFWQAEFGIAGLRLDAADRLDFDFLDALASVTKQKQPDFWLMGEVVNSDYRQWVAPHRLDSVTNYECYKGLWSSHVDANYFEIAYALKRQFAHGGIYQGLQLYNFVDNHDVNRVASNLTNPAHLYPLYCLLFTMPGIPSIYAGSEWGIAGERSEYSDHALRPQLELDMPKPHPDLARAIPRLAQIRQASSALRLGGYQEILTAHKQFAFMRQHERETVLVVLNAASASSEVKLRLPFAQGSGVDVLNDNARHRVVNGTLTVQVFPHWASIITF